MHPYTARIAKGLAAVLFCCTCGWAQAPAAGSTDVRLVNDFEQRTRDYIELRKKIGGNSIAPTNSPETIVAKQHELANALRKARAGAKQGEIFTPDISAYFRRQIASTMRGANGEKIRASLRHAEPVKTQLQINQSYPEKLPLQSTPPTLLLNLPQLPDGLEYRLTGNELVLRDVEANLVVDYVPDALPKE
jgi:hypothetical protein